MHCNHAMPSNHANKNMRANCKKCKQKHHMHRPCNRSAKVHAITQLVCLPVKNMPQHASNCATASSTRKPRNPKPYPNPAPLNQSCRKLRKAPTSVLILGIILSCPFDSAYTSFLLNFQSCCGLWSQHCRSSRNHASKQPHFARLPLEQHCLADGGFLSCSATHVVLQRSTF